MKGTTSMYAAILAGGVGTRLWPRSRQNYPKQFADIVGIGQTMIQATAQRLEGLVDADRTYVVTGSIYARLAAEQLPHLSPAQIVAEPAGRNTAPAIGLACIHLRRRDPNAIVAVLPADHVVVDKEQFQQAMRMAAQASQQGYLVTLGIEPTEPHTGYGYIQRGTMIESDRDEQLTLYAVNRFLEKPNHAAAQSFLSEGGYYWNGGIFVSRVDVMLAEMERWLPDVYTRLETVAAALDGEDAAAALQEAWADMPSISIDYGILERAEKVAVVPLQAGWSDVGSWDALDEILIPDEDNNRVPHNNAVAVESYNNIVYCDRKVVALVGVDDLVVVDTGDALLIGHKRQMQKVKQIVAALAEQNRVDLL